MNLQHLCLVRLGMAPRHGSPRLYLPYNCLSASTAVSLPPHPGRFLRHLVPGGNTLQHLPFSDSCWILSDDSHPNFDLHLFFSTRLHHYNHRRRFNLTSKLHRHCTSIPCHAIKPTSTSDSAQRNTLRDTPVLIRRFSTVMLSLLNSFLHPITNIVTLSCFLYCSGHIHLCSPEHKHVVHIAAAANLISRSRHFHCRLLLFLGSCWLPRLSDQSTLSLCLNGVSRTCLHHCSDCCYCRCCAALLHFRRPSRFHLRYGGASLVMVQNRRSRNEANMDQHRGPHRQD